VLSLWSQLEVRAESETEVPFRCLIADQSQLMRELQKRCEAPGTGPEKVSWYLMQVDVFTALKLVFITMLTTAKLAFEKRLTICLITTCNMTISICLITI